MTGISVPAFTPLV